MKKRIFFTIGFSLFGILNAHMSAFADNEKSLFSVWTNANGETLDLTNCTFESECKITAISKGYTCTRTMVLIPRTYDNQSGFYEYVLNTQCVPTRSESNPVGFIGTGPGNYAKSDDTLTLYDYSKGFLIFK